MKHRPDLSHLTNEELELELKRREDNPTWFIRDLVSDGHDLDTDEFREATNWTDEADHWDWRRRESED